MSTKLPRTTVFLFVIFALLPSAFAMRFGEEYFNPYLGSSNLAVIDVILIGMLVAATVRIMKEHVVRDLPVSVWVPALLVALWFVYEIIRNAGAYGFSAPGEFRYRYAMPLCVPYMMVMFRDPKSRLSVFRVIIGTSVVLIYAVVLFAGFTTGWMFGPANRLLYADANLCLLECGLLFYVANRHGLFNSSKVVKFAVYVPAAILILIDGHRSVWLCAMAALLILVWLKEAKLFRISPAAVILVTAVTVAVMLLFGSTKNLSNFIAERATAYFDVQNDQTASWRAGIWVSVLSDVADRPVAGKGFGGGWGEIYDPSSGNLMQVFPHSYYIMTLYKMGGVGMFFLLLLAFAVGRFMYRNLRRPPEEMDEADHISILLGFVMLVLIHVYGIAYGIEYFSWIFVGLALAACVRVSAPARVIVV